MKDPRRAFRRLDAEGKQLASEAYHLWRALAPERGNPYSDHEYGLRAGRQAVEATRFEDGLVILEGIRRFMDEKSSPVRIPEWARTIGSEKREALRVRERELERAERERQHDEMDPDVRRALIAVARARGRGRSHEDAMHDVTCVVCGQITSTVCARCSRALHERGCRTRHECQPMH